MKNIENAREPYETNNNTATFDLWSMHQEQYCVESNDENGESLRVAFIGPRARERAEQYRGAKNIDILREKDVVRPR